MVCYLYIIYLNLKGAKKALQLKFFKSLISEEIVRFTRHCDKVVSNAQIHAYEGHVSP